MVVVVGQSEVAREVDFDAMSLPNSHGGHNVQKLVEDLRRRLRSALCKPLAHEVRTRSGQRARSSTLRNGSECADGQRNSKNAEVVIVDLITKAGIAGLVKALKLVEAQGKAIRHNEAVEQNGETRLAKCIHFFCLAKDLRPCGDEKVLAVMGIDVVG